MVLEWREREHEDMDCEALGDGPNVHALRRCGLLNLFCTSPMWANVRFLVHFISYWDHNLRTFYLQGEILEIAL